MLKLTMRRIRGSLGRFLAIFGIVALGVGFFCGLRLTKTAMVHTLDVYLDEQNFYDYRLVCTLGFSDDELETVRTQDGVLAAEGAVWKDAVCSIGEIDAMALHSMSVPQQINRLKLHAGRLPQAADECVLDAWTFGEEAIGTTLTLSQENDEDTLEAFEQTSFTVVGLVSSPLYVNYERGSTTVGNGTLAGFFCILPQAYTLDYYTDIYLTLSGAEAEPYSSEYEALIDAKQQQMDDLALTLSSARDVSVRAEANDEIADAKQQIAEHRQELEDGKQEIADAEKKLSDGWQEYHDGVTELEDGRAEAEQELANARQTLYDGAKEIEENETLLEEKIPELQDAKAKLEDGRVQLEDGWAQYNEAFDAFYDGQKEADTQLSGAYAQLASAQSQIDDAQRQIDTSKVQLALGVLTGQVTPEQASEARAQIDAAQKEVDDAQSQLEGGYRAISVQQFSVDGQMDKAAKQLSAARKELLEKQAEFDEAMQQLTDGEAELEEGRQKLEDAKNDLAAGWSEYYEAEEETEQKLLDAEQELEDGKKELEESEQELADAKAELLDGERELEDAEQELLEAEQELRDLEPAECFVLDRSTNTGYVCFESDSDIVQSVSRVFPLFFFLVAALVCITTMTRMVEEQRTEIGVLKAMGYSDGTIASQYLIYTASASLLGCVAGISLGAYLIPKLLWQGYNIMYGFSDILFAFNWPLALVTSAAYLGGSLLITWYTCKSELTQQAAELIRPKAPKAGKRIFLERLPLLWNRIPFLHKVSIRNIVRYKKRMLMMTIGIGGCTALLLTGLGIRDSIQDLVEYQFGEITIYDASVTFADPMTDGEKQAFLDEHAGEIEDICYLSQKNLTCMANDTTRKANVTAVEGSDTAGFVDLHLDGKPVSYPQDGECVISNGLADTLDLKAGDTLTIQKDDYSETTLRVSAVFENYVSSYVFVTEGTWSEAMGLPIEHEQAWVLLCDGADDYAVGAALSSDEAVRNVSLCRQLQQRFSNMMGSMDYIVATVIVFAGALMFVVLYNLTNINITERAREIATVKVLGFYESETDLYVFRENFVLTAIGALVGLPMGVWLHAFVMEQIKLDAITFDVRVAPVSFVLAVVLTLVCSVLASVLLRGKIRRIDMAQALKSIE